MSKPVSFQSNGFVWTREPRRELPRYERGSDWGRDRPLVLDAKGCGRVFWVPGRTAWVQLGTQGYYEGYLSVEFWDKEYQRIVDRRVLEGGRLSIERLNQNGVRHFMASKLGLVASDLPVLHPRFTWTLTKVMTEKSA
jgi:hypothetical protein